jgi:death-on-curing protein
MAGIEAGRSLVDDTALEPRLKSDAGASWQQPHDQRHLALHRPQTGYYDSVIHEAAALLESLALNHPFVDGNKRVVFAAVDVLLRINGFFITADSTAIFHFMMQLFAERTLDMEHLVPWLQENVRGPSR